MHHLAKSLTTCPYCEDLFNEDYSFGGGFTRRISTAMLRDSDQEENNREEEDNSKKKNQGEETN